MRTAQIFHDYVEMVKTLGEQSRQSAARHAGKSLTTATYHLETAVGLGHLERYYTWRSGGQTGYMYREIGVNVELDFEDYEREGGGNG